MHLGYKYLILCRLFTHTDISFVSTTELRLKVDSTRFVVGWLVLLVNCCGALAAGNTTAKCRDNERLSLLSLKRGFVDHERCLSSWGSAENPKDCCTWAFVSCDNQGHVEKLHIPGCYMEGTISPSLGELHHLTHLSLRANTFNRTQFPSFILSLKRLQFLDLSKTNLKGSIPLNLGYSFPQLQSLWLEENQLEGGIPKSLSLCSLTELGLSNNSLSGQLDEFFAPFSHCANISLQYLDLSYNQLTASVPNLSHISFLEILYLNNNQLNGTLNDGIGLLSNLQKLDISSDFLQGVPETHFLRLSQLQILSLSFNNLSFKINSDWIPPFQLYNIELSSCKLGPDFPTWLRSQMICYKLDLSNAEISSSIPSWFWDQTTLKFLNLSHNKIIGEMKNFQTQNNILSMDFSSNLFEGSIPSTLSLTVDLLALDLSNNKFTDASNLLCPNETVELVVLDLSNNQLSGVLPDCWKYFESLLFLDVANNKLFGKIPTSMGSLLSIQSLHLGFNKFSGQIPLSLNKCSELKVFDVVQNDLSGLIPSWIGDGLKKLRVLILRSNSFSGCLPPNICNLSQLQILDLSINNIYGSLPKCLNRLSAMANQTDLDATITHVALIFPIEDIATLVWKGKESKYQSILGLVRSIDLSSNMLIGEIPSELMDLVGLVSLNISRNILGGQIPTKIRQLKLLDFFDLSRNHLLGLILYELSQIDRLSVLDLSYNNLSGEIPHGTQLQSFNPSSYEGNVHLCGAPLAKCPTTQDRSNNENFEDGQFFNRGFFISLSLGFGIGFGGVCSFIFLNKSFRYAYFRLLNHIYVKVYVVVAINMAKLHRRRKSSST